MIPDIMNPGDLTPHEIILLRMALVLISRKEENSPCAFSGTMKKGAVHKDDSH